MVNIDSHRSQTLARGREAQRLDALGQLTLYCEFDLHGYGIPNADDRSCTDLSCGYKPLARRESYGSHIIAMVVEKALLMRGWVIYNSKGSCMVGNALVLKDADVVPGVTSSVAVDPLKLEFDYGCLELADRWLLPARGSSDLLLPRLDGHELIAMADVLLFNERIATTLNEWLLLSTAELILDFNLHLLL